MYVQLLCANNKKVKALKSKHTNRKSYGWHRPVISAFGRPKQEDCPGFKTSLEYRVRGHLENFQGDKVQKEELEIWLGG